MRMKVKGYYLKNCFCIGSHMGQASNKDSKPKATSWAVSLVAV